MGSSAVMETSVIGIEVLQFSSTRNRNVSISSTIAAKALTSIKCFVV